MDVLGIFTHLRGDDGQWSGWEQDELSRLKTASAAVLENQIWEDGVTDDGGAVSVVEVASVVVVEPPAVVEVDSSSGSSSGSSPSVVLGSEG